MPVREAALRPLYKKIDALITDKVKDFFEMADGYSDVVVENGNTPYSRPLPHQPYPSISPGPGPLLLALAFALAQTLALAMSRQHRDRQRLREARTVQQDTGR